METKDGVGGMRGVLCQSGVVSYVLCCVVWCCAPRSHNKAGVVICTTQGLGGGGLEGRLCLHQGRY